VLLDQLGWIKLKPNTDPLKASEKDVAANIKKIKLLPLEAAQLPRSCRTPTTPSSTGTTRWPRA
jgi:D-methionine transport system substrate-binding protein